jgi:hypothetical protein
MKLLELAKVIRSKNAGPTTLSIDIMFNDEAGYHRAIVAPALAPAAIAVLYGMREHQVRVIPYAPAIAIKMVMERRLVAGTPGDTDVYGAQQHGPLLALEI